MLEEAAGAFFKKTRLARFGADIHLSGMSPSRADSDRA